MWLRVFIIIPFLGHAIFAAKFQRYGLPLLMVLDMLAAAGLVVMAQWWWRRSGANALLRTRDDGTLEAALKDPGFDAIRGEPRFRDILRAVAPETQ